MASRIVVMKDGFIRQIGTPHEIYQHPANLFVAGFIGTPAMNFLYGTLNSDGTFSMRGSALATAGFIPERFGSVFLVTTRAI